MTSLDILFWLLIALMGGITWAIEAGLGQRHRNELASSMLAALGAILIMMFLIDDISVLNMFDKSADPKGGAKGEEQAKEAPGEVDFGGDKKRKQIAAASKSKGSSKDEAGSGTASSGQDQKNEKDRRSSEEEGQIEYSREPFKDCPQCPDMVIMSAGTSQSGSASDEPGRMPGEADAKQSKIEKPFAIGRVEITRAEFAAFVKASGYTTQTQCEMGKRRGRFDWSRPGFEQDDRHSVVCVSLRDVTAYLDWLSDKSGRMYALPTEVEWEYAARAGTDSPYWTGDSLNKTQANVGRSRDGTTPVGLFPMNQFGLSDVAGNAGEMTGECASEPSNTSAPTAKADTATCRRLIKGGAWNAPAQDARHAARSYLTDGTATNFVGFRVIRGVDNRDDHLILTATQKKAIAKAKLDALELSTKERDGVEKAKIDNRENAYKLVLIAKEKAAAKAKTKADAEAKKQVDLLKEAEKQKKK